MKKDLLMESPEPPRDVAGIVYASFFMLGVGTLFAWNAFITAATYYGKRFCGSPHESTFENDVGLAYMASNLAMLCLVVRYQSMFTRRFRVLGSFVAWFFVFAFITAEVLLKDISVGFLYWSTMVGCVLCGIFGAICSGGVFGMVAAFPPMYVQAVMSGQGLSGLTAALVSMGAAIGNDSTADSCDDDDDDGNDSLDDKAVVVDDDDDDGNGDCSEYTSIDYGSFAYFMVACLIFLMCIVGYLALEQSPFAQYYDQGTPSKAAATQQPTAVPSSDTEYDENSSEVYTPLGGGGGMVEASFPAADGGEEPTSSGNNNKGPSSDTTPTLADYKRVLGAMRSEAFAVWFVFSVTIGLFPALSARIRPLEQNGCSSGAPFSNATFTALLFLFFNLFDLIGRSGAGFVQFIPMEWLPTASLCRLVFVPLFALCNVTDSQLHVVFSSSAWPLLFMACMALSNGYVSTLAMIYGPQRIDKASSDSEIAGSVMILALTCGLFTGSMLAYPISFAVVGSMS